MGFIDDFKNIWAPYSTEEEMAKFFTNSRGHNFPTQYNTGDIKFKTYSYDVDTLCSFLIIQKSSLFSTLGGGTVNDPWNYTTLESLSMFPNPTRIALSEPTKQEITPLQYNSKIVERGGMPLKTLSISGNFGFFPGRSKIAPQGKLPRDGIGSGLFFSMLWSSFFRYYEELVSYDIDANDIRLVFIDHVKQESWIVEPNSIDNEQNAGQKFQHPYSWAFTTLAPYDFNFWPIISASNWDNIVSIVADLKEYAAELERLSARLSKFVTDFVDTILGPLYDIIDALDSVLSGVDIVMSIPKQVVGQLEKALADLQDALDFSKDDDNFPLEIDTAFAVQNVKKQLKKVGGTQELFIPESNYSSNKGSTLYSAPRINSETGEILERGEDAPIIATESVKEGDTVQVIAKRVFGTFAGWEEIVSINGLRPPYIASQSDIDSQGLKGVIAYGETISYTVNGKFSTKKSLSKKTTTPMPIVNETIKTKKLSPFERALGTDIALEDGDVVFTKDNDFKLVSGLDNVKQQLGHKFGIEKGKLRSAEYIGITKTVGREAALSEFVIRQDITSMVNADKRLNGVEIESFRDGDVLNADVKIDIRDIKEPLPVKIRQGY